MELVRSFSNISFFFIVSLSFFIAIEHVRLKIIIRNTSDVIGNRSISLRKMNIILVPFLLPLKLSPIWQIRSIPVVTTDVHRSTNRRNKIPNYPWKKHDKIVRNWHPSSHLHTRPPILHSLHRPVSNQCLTSQRFFPLLYSFFFPSREIKQCLTVKTRGKMRLEGNLISRPKYSSRNWGKKKI